MILSYTNKKEAKMAMIHLQDRKKKIIYLYKSGLSVSKLSKQFKCSWITMNNALKEWGVK
jgi:lambda repressor-like predicted transcriptional regulator